MATSNKELVLVPRNIVFPTARFLSPEEREAYEDAISQYSGKAREFLDVYGSNLFKILKLNEIFPNGKRIATLADLGQIVETDKDYLSGFFVDAPVVVLRSAGDSYQLNDSLAKSLAKQVRKRTFKNPVIITGLEVEASNDSAYGLKFRKTDKTKVIDAPELANENDRRRFTKTDERGMPIFDKNGNRILYTRKSGLSRVNLDSQLNFGSSSVDLAFSSLGGRVIVINENDERRGE